MSETTIETAPVMTRSEIKAAKAALDAASAETRKAEAKVATKVAQSVLRLVTDEHTFQTGSKGRSVRQNVVVGGRKAFLNATLVFSDTVVKVDTEAEVETAGA